MNKKKILGAVCALACATNFAFVQPVSAEYSVHEQEKWARHLEQETFGGAPQTYSNEAKRVTPIVQKIQKRLCDKNGIEVTTTLFQNPHDFEVKVHPVQVIDNYEFSAATCAGYIYMGTNVFKRTNIGVFSDQYDYILCEKIIAHETGHSIGGHGLSKKFNNTAEPLAEKKSVELLDKLPEGGWGAYLASISRSENYPTINQDIKKSFVKATGGKVSMPTYSTTVYHAKKGGQYNLCIKNGRSMDNAYFGGQMADCIAHKALTVESLDVIPVPTELKESIKFKGDYIIVCRSNKLPNGYRILASLYGSQDRVMDDWSRMKGLVLKGDGDIEWYSNMAKLTINSGDDSKHNMWRMWLALAVANDVQNR